MNLGDLNSLGHNKNSETNNNFLVNFVKELQNTVCNFIKSSSISLEESIYAVRDINDEKLSLVNIANGQEHGIYVITSQEKAQELQNQGIFDNIYEMSKEDFYSLNLGSNLTIKNGKCTPYYGEVKIENSLAAAKLEDMYFCIEQEKDAIYSVTEISDEKIFLTSTTEGGYFSIPKEVYPNFKLGDLVKNINGKYTLI